MTAVAPDLELRSPEFLMTPQRLSAQKPMRLSFARLLLRRAISEQWQISQRSAQVDHEGRGELVYDLRARDVEMHALVFTDKLGADKTDRAIATEWDLTLCLVEGELTPDVIDMARGAPPRDGGAGSDPRFGRVDRRALLYLCGNRSGRIFDHVVDSLTEGHQPDIGEVARVGYLMRGINHVANGMMNTRMFAYLPEEHPLRGPYFAQMLGCYLIREISCDLVDEIARRRSSVAVPLDEDIRRYLGVGDSTGIGLGLMINRHPILVDRWITLRETALARAKSTNTDQCRRDARRLHALIRRCARYADEDGSDQGFYTPSTTIGRELYSLSETVAEFDASGTIGGTEVDRPWAHLCEIANRDTDIETQETLNSLLVELYPDVTDALAPQMLVNEAFDVIPEMSIGELREIVEGDYDWALSWDLSPAEARHWLWYRTAVGGEPRLTRAGAEPDEAERNVALDLIGEIQALHSLLTSSAPDLSVAQFLFHRPHVRATVERVQSLIGLQYHSPRMNMLAHDFVPIDLGRFVLFALKGMTKPSPQNTVWIRGVMAQGAPLMEEIRAGATDDWVYPPTPEVAE